MLIVLCFHRSKVNLNYKMQMVFLKGFQNEINVLKYKVEFESKKAFMVEVENDKIETHE